MLAEGAVSIVAAATRVSCLITVLALYCRLLILLRRCLGFPFGVVLPFVPEWM